MTKKFARICPKCKSTNVSVDISLQSFAQGTFFNQYMCNNCGYVGQFFPEITHFVKISKKKK